MQHCKKRISTLPLVLLTTLLLCGAAPASAAAAPSAATVSQSTPEGDRLSQASASPITLSSQFMEEAGELAQRHDEESEESSFEVLNAPEVFVAQPRDGTCTLTSVTMMLRRAALLRGMENWQEITTETVETTAWTYGLGMNNEFESFGMEVAIQSLPGGGENAAVLTRLLDEHPEGVALYAPGVPHCVLLTDVQDGVFYCADTLDASVGRTTIDNAYGVTIENATDCWVVTTARSEEPKSEEDCAAPVIRDCQVRFTESDTLLLSCRAEDETDAAVYFALWKTGEPADIQWLEATRLNLYHHLELTPGEWEAGEYQAAVFACDSAGNYCAAPMRTLTLEAPEPEVEEAPAVLPEEPPSLPDLAEEP